MREPKQNYIALHFLEANRKLDSLEPYLMQNWAEDWYVTMLTFPINEMLTKDFVSQVEELLEYGISEFNGKVQLNRPARAGDIITEGTKFWLLLPTKMIPKTVTKEYIETLKKWPDVSLLFIGEYTGCVA